MMDLIHEPGEVRDAVLRRMREEGDRTAADMVRETTGGDEYSASETVDEPSSDHSRPVIEYASGNPFIAVRLTHPFRIDGKLISSLLLRPPRYDAVLAVLSGNMRHTEMFAEMAGVDEGIVIALRWPDAAEVIRTCHFLAPDLSVT